MTLPHTLYGLFHELGELLGRLSPLEYSQPCHLLSGGSIGQHCRHVIECFQELEKGYSGGTVNYDLRQRQRLLETDAELARRQLWQIGDGLARPDKPLVLEVRLEEGRVVRLASSYYRELYHNLDHLVHHMALIRVGLIALGGISVPDGFGVAYATMRFRAEQSTITANGQPIITTN